MLKKEVVEKILDIAEGKIFFHLEEDTFGYHYIENNYFDKDLGYMLEHTPFSYI